MTILTYNLSNSRSVCFYLTIMEEFLPLLTNDDEELVLFDLILNTKDREYHYLDKIPGVFDLDNRLLLHSFPFLQSGHPAVGSRFEYS